MENTKKDTQTALATVKPIAGTSPLAVGFTVNICEAAHPEGPWWLRVWNNGQPVENSRWPSPSKAAMRVGAIVLDGTVGSNLRGQAMAAAAHIMSGGGFGGEG